MTTWFIDQIDRSLKDKQLKTQLLRQGILLRDGRGTRTDAAGFFSALQMLGTDSDLEQIWERFCKQLAIDGLAVGDTKYSALLNLTESNCSDTHRILAKLLEAKCCHVLNLNYDPLLLLASRDLANKTPKSPGAFVPLYSQEDVTSYYTANNPATHTLQAAVTNARGDVFFAKCRNTVCPQKHVHRVLEPERFTSPNDIFQCPVCRQNTSRLQLSFPGYEAKERLVKDIAHAQRRYISRRVSMIVCLGLSGQWDPFLLNEIFDFAVTDDIPVLDVRPLPSTGVAPLNHFRQHIYRYFPEVQIGLDEMTASYLQVDSKADVFCQSLLNYISIPQPPDAKQGELYNENH
jgi:hypothetical protein